MCRLAAGQVLTSQAITLLPAASVHADLVGGAVAVSYWPEAAPINSDCLLSPAARASLRNAAAAPPAAATSGAPAGAAGAPARLMGAQVILRSSRSGAAASGAGGAATAPMYPLPAPVEVEHVPRLVDDSGRVLALPVSRSALSVERLLAAARLAHTRCRLRVLHRTLAAAAGGGGGGDEAADWSGLGYSIGADAQEVVVSLGGRPRLRHGPSATRSARPPARPLNCPACRRRSLCRRYRIPSSLLLPRVLASLRTWLQPSGP